jgi:hypothetical protein
VRIAVEGRDAKGEVVRHGTVELEGPAVRATVAPGGDEKLVRMVASRRVGPDMLEPGTEAWLEMLPAAYSGTRMWCRRV